MDKKEPYRINLNDASTQFALSTAKNCLEFLLPLYRRDADEEKDSTVQQQKYEELREMEATLEVLKQTKNN